VGVGSRCNEPRLAKGAWQQASDIRSVHWERKEAGAKKRHAAGVAALSGAQARALAAAGRGVIFHENKAHFVLNGRNDAAIKQGIVRKPENLVLMRCVSRRRARL